MFGIGGVARCTFLWTAKRDFRINELHVPHGVLELTTMRDDVRDKISCVVESAGISVILRFKKEHDGNSRYYNDKRSRDSRDDRDRHRERRVSRPPHANDHRHRPRSSGAFFYGATAAGSAWTSRAQSTDNAMESWFGWEDGVVVAAILFVGVLIGMLIGRLVYRDAKEPVAQPRATEGPQVTPSPCPSNGGTSPRRQSRSRESSSTTKVDESSAILGVTVSDAPSVPVVASDSNGSLSQDDHPPASTSSSIVRRRRKAYVPYPYEQVIFTETGTRFHLRSECDGLRNAAILRIAPWKNCNPELTPCQLCAGASVLR